MIKKIFFGLFLGIIGTIISLQYNESVQATISREFKKAFEEALDCQVEFSLKRINFFLPCLELEHMKVKSRKDNDWSWHTNFFSAGFSWFHLFLKRAVNLRVTIGTISACSQYDENKLAIMPHIERMMRPAMGVPISLSELKLQHASFELHDPDKKNKGTITWQSHSKKMSGTFKTIVHILDGKGIIDNKLLLSHYTGDIHIELIEQPDKKLEAIAHISTNGMIHPHSSDPFLLTLKGQWDKNNGSLIIKSPNQKLITIKTIAHQSDEIIALDTDITLDINLCSNLAGIIFGLTLPNFNGALTMKAHNTIASSGFAGIFNLQAHNVYLNNTQLCNNLDASLNIEKKLINSHCSIEFDKNQTIDASIFYNLDQSNGMLGIQVKDPITLPILKLPACTAQCSYDGNNQKGTGSYAFHHIKPESQAILQGSYELDWPNIIIKGNHQSAIFESSLCLNPFGILYAHYTQQPTNQTLFELKSSSHDRLHIQSTIDVSLIKDLLKTQLAHHIQADGKLLIEARAKDHIITGTCNLSQANIRLPQTYNFISGLSIPFQIDFDKKKCTISKAECLLHKGSLVCQKGTISLTENHNLNFIHLPILFDSCLLNPTKDLFAIVSGSCLFSYQNGKAPFLQSNVIIERSQLKENLFSPTFQKALFAPNTGTPPHINCDITLQTRDPIRIKTAFLEANAKVNINIGNSFPNPYLSGSIQIDSGTLSFPYKPLYINRAEIVLQPHKLNDPIIELLAKNTIKKHQVTLAVSGSLQNHTISLESSPSLSEDQIMALLLVGSPNESLNIVMPALVMQNIKNIIFESEQSPLKLDNYFRHMLKPLKHIHLAPSFIDQTARGGLRGGIEIEIGDRWRALIQKNFSLSEDTRFELEYLVSDDVSIRAIRDERRDASAEAEFRWKF